MKRKMSLKQRAGSSLAPVFISIISLLWSCSEVIDLGSEGSEALLVVNGRLTDGAFGNEVNLATTSAINANQTAVGNARITLIEDGNPIARYEEYETGSYRLDYP